MSDRMWPAETALRSEKHYTARSLFLDQVSHCGGGTYPHSPHISGRFVSVDAHLGFIASNPSSLGPAEAVARLDGRTSKQTWLAVTS